MPKPHVDYQEILDIISEENCALFIGPGLLKSDEGLLLEESMWKSIGATDPNHRFIRTFYKEDGLVLLHEENMRRRLVRKIRGFYNEDNDHAAANDILRKIARLPISLIFNLTKHNLLGGAFKEENQPFHYDFYFKGHPHQPFITPTKDKPLIYNLLGDVEEPESIILTHKDLFDYLESIFTGNSMSPELRKLIQDTDFFFFLGLPFEKWYMQLLLRVLYHISSRLEKIEQFASLPSAKNVNTIFQDEFKIKFLPDDGMTFMDGLFALFENEEMLKSEKEEGQEMDIAIILDQAKEAFAKDKMNRGFKAIESVLQSHTPMTSEALNKFLATKNYYYDLEQKEVNSIATTDDRIEMRKVVMNLISMVDDIKALFS